MAFVVAVEGVDGAGKSSVIKELGKKLKEAKLKYAVVPYIPPGLLRQAVLEDEDLTSFERLLLYRVAAEKVWRSIDAFKQTVDVVLLDRGPDSFLAYQGFGDGYLAEILKLDEMFGSARRPDLSIILTVSLETSLARRRTRNQLPDMIEQRKTEFFERVIEGFRDLTQKSPILLDAVSTGAAKNVFHYDPHHRVIFLIGDASSLSRVSVNAEQALTDVVADTWSAIKIALEK
jgi:dTMP kinase